MGEARAKWRYAGVRWQDGLHTLMLWLGGEKDDDHHFIAKWAGGTYMNNIERRKGEKISES